MLKVKISEVMDLGLSAFLFFLSYFTFSFIAMERTNSANSPNLPDEKQEVVAWLPAFLDLEELLVLLCAELAASEPGPAAACAGGGAELS